jgi:hypothetical protein
MSLWTTWKKGFDAWEAEAAKLNEQVLSSPLVLEPAGVVLSTAMKLKAAGDRAVAAWWGSWGLPTKRDQERTLHQLNQLHSRLFDLEEQLTELRRSQGA